MKILSFKNFNFTIIKEKDETNRAIGYSLINDCKLVGRNNFNPNVLLYDGINLISPYDEKVMSLNKESFYDNNEYELEDSNNIIEPNVNIPVFFFIYNFDNYYHFLYDTLPYLYTYLEKKKNIPDLKLLVNYPNKFKKDFYKFNSEFLNLIINESDIIIHKDDNIYKDVYISTSLTHGGYSNNPPRQEIYEIYQLIKNNVPKIINTPKLVYISRRTWINNNKTNIGTDYTTRRKMINEDILVEKLKTIGFEEIFSENLSTEEKINLFSNAEIVVGSIGGGMANLLFGNKHTKSYVFVTPYFLDINYRFKYSMENTDITYYNNIITYKEDNDIPLFCRVKINSDNKIGEIIDYKNGKYLINISDNDIAGFNNNIKYHQEYYNSKDFILLDKGLNSPYIINIDKFLELLS